MLALGMKGEDLPGGKWGEGKEMSRWKQRELLE